MMSRANHPFHLDETGTGDGNIFLNSNGYRSMQLQFITDGTFSATIKVRLIDTEQWYTYPSFKLPTYDLITSAITDKTCLYKIDISEVTAIKVELTANSDSLTCQGRAVD